MNLSQVKQYTEGLLKKWFTNKKTLDKFSEDAEGELLYNNEELGKFDSVNLKTENILPAPIVITPSNRDITKSFTTQLSKNIEDYAWAELRCHWEAGSNSYYHNHNIETRTNGKSQWITQYWSGGEDGNSVASNNGFVIGVQGKDFDVKFTDLETGTITIEKIIGYKVTEVTDGTPFAHEHSNNSVLDLLTSDDNQVLKFNNKPLTPESYKKTLWTGSSSNSTTSSKHSALINLEESCLNYDATVFYFRLYLDSTVYEHTDINYVVKTGVNLWVSKLYTPGSYMFGNYTINSAGNIVFTNLGKEGFDKVELYKVEGIKYGRA